MSSVDFDVVVVGAGVVGLAVARACALAGHRVLVMEQAGRVGTGISARNSEVIHAGLYYPEGSLKATLCVRGREALYEYCRQRGIAQQRCGKLVVATDVSQHEQLEAIFQQGARNGVRDLVWLSGTEVRQLEPEVFCTQAFLSPSTGIIDARAFMTSLVGDLEARGGWVSLQTRFESAERDAAAFRINARSQGEATVVRSRWLINSAGLDAMAVAARVSGLAPQFIPKLYLAKGHYFAVSGRPFKRLVYPLPAAGGLGVHATLQLDGAVRFGPDVEWVDRVDYDVQPGRARLFQAAIRRYWPNLPEGALQPAYAGLRPKISGPGEPAADFRIDGPGEHGIEGLINLLGIESPGLTASLALAEACAALAGLTPPGSLT
ncbi:MAG: NAD(P)/FAD-dependent oxidoreductase [Proteobacteria bacterium]|nr:NAD(P)/FAD-dependent oxidoreductase [Pseudomonadota bacterium]